GSEAVAKGHQWSGFGIRPPPAASSGGECQILKLHWNLRFGGGPLVLTFAKVAPARGANVRTGPPPGPVPSYDSRDFAAVLAHTALAPQGSVSILSTYSIKWDWGWSA